jgi:hypothetical protein
MVRGARNDVPDRTEVHRAAVEHQIVVLGEVGGSRAVRGIGEFDREIEPQENPLSLISVIVYILKW